jgi:LPS-assembly protein
VGRVQFAPTRNLSFVTRGRFDQDDFAMERIEVGAMASLNPWVPLSTSITYARYAAQPELGYENRREGLVGSARLGITDNWFVTGSVLLDLDRYLTAREQFVTDYLNNPDTAVYRREDNIKVSSLSLGLGYMDECTTFTVQYIMTPRDVALASGEKDRNQTLMFSLEFRTLGEVSLRQAISGTDDVADR